MKRTLAIAIVAYLTLLPSACSAMPPTAGWLEGPSAELTDHPVTATPTAPLTSRSSPTPSASNNCEPGNIGQPSALSLIPTDDPTIALDVSDRIIEYLNAGGDIPRLGSYLGQCVGLSLSEQDLTGDGRTELVIAGNQMMVLSRAEAGYQLAFKTDVVFYGYYEIADVQDLQRNGVVDLLLILHDFIPVQASSSYQILEWDGRQFQYRLRFSDLALPGQLCDSVNVVGPMCVENGWYRSVGYAHPGQPAWEWVDRDQDGTVELVIHDGVLTGADFDANGPWRVRTNVFGWDGAGYSILQRALEPARYRFQAVQDADHAVALGEYETARRLYQRVISDDSLEWWTRDRQSFEYSLALGVDPQTPTPTAPVPDASERIALATYSQYRLVLLSLLEGANEQAREAVAATQAIGGNTTPGGIYVEMAEALWSEYLTTQDIVRACARAVAIATEHPDEALYYLGSSHHGYQSLRYRPEDTCLAP